MKHGALVRHQHRHFSIRQNRRGCATKDHLFQATLGIATLDDQIRAKFCCLLENNLAGVCGGASTGHNLQFRINRIPTQIGDHVLS